MMWHINVTLEILLKVAAKNLCLNYLNGSKVKLELLTNDVITVAIIWYFIPNTFGIKAHANYQLKKQRNQLNSGCFLKM